MKIFLIIFLFVATSSQASVIKVGAKETCKTITAGVALAKNGDSVVVQKGTYFEKNLLISRPVYLIGIDYPVLDGEGAFEIITITSDDVLVQGFHLKNSGVSSILDYAAIRIADSRNVTISNNQVFNCFFGIYLQNAVRCLILNNKIRAAGTTEQQSGNGIHCWKSDSIRLVSNDISAHRDGIYFEFVTHSVIWGNRSHKNLRYGLHFMFSNNNAYVSNTLSNNGAGVAVMFSSKIIMIRNCFARNWGDAAYGILLKEITDSKLEDNIFENNTTAVFAEGASRIVFSRNVFRYNGYAIRIQASCMDISVESNNFLGNTFDVGTNGSLVLNSFDRNYWDKYEGYDLDKDQVGDVPYRPISLYSMIVETNPSVMMLFHSFITTVMDKSEKVIPSLTPESFKDVRPLMKPLRL